MLSTLRRRHNGGLIIISKWCWCCCSWVIVIAIANARSSYSETVSNAGWLGAAAKLSSRIGVHGRNHRHANSYWTDTRLFPSVDDNWSPSEFPDWLTSGTLMNGGTLCIQYTLWHLVMFDVWNKLHLTSFCSFPFSWQYADTFSRHRQPLSNVNFK